MQLLSVTPVVKKGLLVNVPLVRSNPLYSSSPRSLLNSQCLALVRDGRNVSLGNTMRTKRLLRTSRSEWFASIDANTGPLAYQYFLI